MLRLIFVFAAAGVVTLALLPFQAVAVRLDLPLRRRIPQRFHQIVCAILGVRVHEVGRRMPEHPLLIVANHSSWLDISVISAVAPVVFVAKQEVAGWPVIGRLAKLQRTVFVDRARRHKTADVNAEIAMRLAQGDPVVLFGEGTSSDGNRVLPFRSALIGSARDALADAEHTGRVWIQPLSLAYTHMRGDAARALRPPARRLVREDVDGTASRQHGPGGGHRRHRDVGRAGGLRRAVGPQAGRPRARSAGAPAHRADVARGESIIGFPIVRSPAPHI